MDNKVKEFRYDYLFLSNFSNIGLTYKGIRFSNSEQAYQWDKAETEEDKALILGCTSAKRAKEIGHTIKCNIEEWDKIKISRMEDVLRAKFSQNHLRKMLIGTKGMELVEGNYWHDNYWGDCYCNSCKYIEGQNILGKVLMKIRDESD